MICIKKKLKVLPYAWEILTFCLRVKKKIEPQPYITEVR